MISLTALGGLGPQLGDPGGQGIVHESGNDPDLLIKSYLPTTYVDPDGLQRLIDWRKQLDPIDLATIDESTSWPRDLVDLGSGLYGVTFQRAPAQFSHVVEGQLAPRNLNWAFREKECRWVGLTPLSPSNSWLLLLKIMQLIAILHRNGVAYRDVSNTNFFFDSTTDPRPFAIDCDSAHELGAGPGLRGTPITLGYDCPLPGLDPLELDVWKLTMMCDRIGLFFTGAITATTTRLKISGGRPASPEYVDLHRTVMTGKRPLPTITDLVDVCTGMVDGLRRRGII